VPLAVFAAIVFAEALLWRPVEVVLIVNNGLGKFGRAAVLSIVTTAFRALGAVLFMLSGSTASGCGHCSISAPTPPRCCFAFGFYYPRQRLRLRTELYVRRLADSIYVAGAEVLFYLQSEFDKLLVLAIGGPHLAGIYAIIMRLVDLTAIRSAPSR